MHEIFYWLHEEAWARIEPFSVPLEQEREPKPLKLTSKVKKDCLKCQQLTSS
jgi:hypothetical protein